VERHGYSGFALEEADDLEAYAATLEAFRTRPREFPEDADGMSATYDLVKERLEVLSADRTADAWFWAEREYWMSHNKAAQVQKARQDALGVGWANHDHQAYRCSRELFIKAVEILELLGMRRREVYYAGEQAGWGAQVMEQPVGRFVAFTDVDLAPDEMELDFATEGLAPRDELGTIGLWVGLHGESMLQAGFHHMAAAFSMERIVQDLYTRDVGTMPPFSEFPFLRQTFTVAETWAVVEGRARALLEGGFIGEQEFETFGEKGAIGSHLELIDRTEGFKGFNQDSVSTIITATDPRTQP
jgi:hypothetical protein